MDEDHKISPIDYEDLKRRIADEVRAIFRELAAEKCVSRDEYVEYLKRHHRP
jgi:predicted transcriptional regulator